VAGASDAIRKAKWSEEDPRSVAENLGLVEALARVDKAAKDSMFFSIPLVPGVAKEDLVRSLAFYTGSEFAESMIYAPTGATVYGPPSPHP
jgi:hypothetical protein